MRIGAFILIQWILGCGLLYAQPSIVAPRVNRTLQVLHEQNPGYQWNHEAKSFKSNHDTLELPFRDDFSGTHLYPDSSKWLNNYVYINGDFGVNPPTYGVATFDYLDAFGNPYTPLSSGSAPGDSLTSKPIDLLSYQGLPIGPRDSVYLSFYLQPQGRGEAPGLADILYLEFKNEFNIWERVWEMKGGALKPFEQIIIPIDSARFFHRGFQFQFINITKQSGNLNHWHLDYIMLDKDRRVDVDYYDDYAVQTRPTSLLKNWASMPWDHFLAEKNSELADSIFFNVSNLNNATLNIEVRYNESSEGNVLNSTNFASNAANVPASGWEKRRFRSYDFSSLSGERVTIDRTYELREPSVINRYTDNDAIKVEQVFDNYFAYDDGTAEGGFGWDSDVPFPAGVGRIAVKYRLNKPDTLWAVGMFFNQSRTNVSQQNFTLKVWKKVNIGGSFQQDEEYWSYEANGPVYTNERNGFYLFKLDTLLILPAGDYYIGWTQIGTFNLNVGWDMNYGYIANKEGANPGIYYNILGDWRTWNASGAPMIRPYIGSEPQIPASLNHKSMPNIRVWPNPASHEIFLSGLEGFATYRIYSFDGKVVLEGKTEAGAIDVRKLESGIFVIELSDDNGSVQRVKWIKANE